MDRMIKMIVQMVMRHGVTKGIDYAARRGRDPKEMTPAERSSAQQTNKRTRQAMRIIRRFGRF